jgi:DNA-binding NtrC family response regulator
MKHILLLEDDEIYRKMLKKNLSRYGRVFEASNLLDGIKILETLRIDFTFIDLDLNGQKLAGLGLLEKAKGSRSIILSSHEEEEVIQKAYEMGAEIFLNKWDFDKYLLSNIKSLFSNNDLDPDDYYETLNIEFKKDITKTVTNFEKSNDSLLITGDTGSGKGFFVKSLLKNKEYIHVNLSEFSKSTIESELFGHSKGSFTGALEDKRGLLRKADKGILFLDEIGTLDLDLQKKLLRVIEEGEFYPVGSDNPVKIDFRLICATCDDLNKLVQEGLFREDFLYRINGITLRIPSLSERPEDILNQISIFNRKNVSKICFSGEAKEMIASHEWRGNYRELLSFFKRQQSLTKGLIGKRSIEKDLKVSEVGMFLDSKMKTFIKSEGMGAFVNRVEKEIIVWGKELNRGALNQTIKMLGISKSLYYRIDKYSDLVTPTKT